jgi:type III secretion system YscD/HrpQ family protein
LHNNQNKSSQKEESYDIDIARYPANQAMDCETVYMEKLIDNFEWAAEFGYLNEIPASLQSTMPGSEKCHQLMIFSGLHEDASMPLRDGTYSVGRSYECDIVLKDPGIAPIHLKLICDEGAIALRPELGAVYVDGQQVKHETVLSEPPAVVTIAGIHFGLAVEGAAWCPLAFPEIATDAENFTEEEQGELTEANDDNLPKPVHTAAIETFIASFTRLAKAHVLSKYVLLTFILIFITSAVFFFHIKEPDNFALIADIEKQFTERRLPKPAIQVDAEGFLDVTAYAPDVKKKKEIIGILQTLPVTVRSHVYTDEEVGRALQDYISKMAYTLETIYQGRGRVLVKGFVENQQEADLMRGLLKSNVMGVRSVEFNLFFLDKMRPDLLVILEEFDLKDKIEFRPQIQNLLAQGSLGGEENVRWQNAKKTILDRWDRRFDIIDQTKAQAYATLPGKIDIPIAGVTLQPHPFITLQDGKVYFKGASLQNGTVIKDIGREKIIVEYNGQEYYYNF